MSEQDHRLGDAWRAASRDEPSATLDDAIRAAARREVGAGPRRSRARAWMPLAAAATIAALAIGIVEMMPREEVAPGMSSETMSAPSAASPASSASQKPAAPPANDATEATAREAPSSMAQASRSAKTAAGGERRELATKQQAPASSPTAQAPPEAFPASPRAVVPQARSEAATPQQQPAAAAQFQASKPERRSLDAASRRAVDVPREGADARSASDDQPSSRMTAPAPAASSPPRTPAPAMAPSPPAALSASGALRGNAAQIARKTDSQAASDDTAAADQADAMKSKDIIARAKDAPARPADEWIRLIQRLRYEGKIAEAAKELAAFRAAYKDRADALLPRDLRDAKP